MWLLERVAAVRQQMEDHPGREVPDGRWRETKIMAKIGFIGMGNIGYAIMRSLLNKYKTEDITFTDLNRRRVAQIEKETGVKAVDTNQDCAENAKYIVLAIKPQFYDNVLADIKDHVTKENIIISIAPGITIDSVNEKLGGDRVSCVRAEHAGADRRGYDRCLLRQEAV